MATTAPLLGGHKGVAIQIDSEDNVKILAEDSSVHFSDSGSDDERGGSSAVELAPKPVRGLLAVALLIGFGTVMFVVYHSTEIMKETLDEKQPSEDVSKTVLSLQNRSESAAAASDVGVAKGNPSSSTAALPLVQTAGFQGLGVRHSGEAQAQCLGSAKRLVREFAEETASRIRRSSILPGEVSSKAADIFLRAYVMNIERTAHVLQDGTVFVTTGDIGDMWIRDSSAQFHNYIWLARNDSCMLMLLEGLVQRQSEFMLMDSYANSYRRRMEFNDLGLGRGGYVTTRNYEIDSICYWVRLAYLLWKTTKRKGHFDQSFGVAAKKVIAQLTKEQHHEHSTYSYPELPRQGKGTPVTFTGMTWDAFRPSDDACTYGYHIPSNLFAVRALTQLREILDTHFTDQETGRLALLLSQQIEKGVRDKGTTQNAQSDNRRIFAYETDGSGNFNLMDDANIPSLLSIPYHMDESGTFPFPSPDSHSQLYKDTRAFVLSDKNPYFVKGRLASGVSSPHMQTAARHMVWHMALVMDGLTLEKSDKQGRLRVLTELTQTASNNELHEAFDPNNPNVLTRPFFGWPNALFCEFVLQMFANGEI